MHFTKLRKINVESKRVDFKREAWPRVLIDSHVIGADRARRAAPLCARSPRVCVCVVAMPAKGATRAAEDVSPNVNVKTCIAFWGVFVLKMCKLLISNLSSC